MLNIKHSTIIDEHFVPESGLDLNTYIKNGDIAGVHHLIRYYWTREIIKDNLSTKTIFDIACGAGFGSYLIAKNFPNIDVIGADYDHQAIEGAQKNYSLPNLTFQFGDGCRWDET
ncbi:MAG: class I SAM-dependent methyltransferase, partial [Methanosarcinaceae archaeon]|nr:class I SAM-dependent methyltransferase [Methanosarcinaceae archaeon]